MANPQKENGHIQISTELWEAWARIRINGEAEQVLKIIIRKTYGFNKKQDAISLSQFSLSTGMKKTSIQRALSKLKALNLIHQKESPIANIYSFNKDFDTWKPTPKKSRGTLKRVRGGLQKDIFRTPKRGIQYTVTKDTTTKDKSVVATPLPPTPLRRKDDFFENLENQDKVITWLVGKGMDEDLAKQELTKFVSYWTEQDSKGKMRYESQKFFEVKKRLATWFSRVNGSFNNKPSAGRTRKVVKL